MSITNLKLGILKSDESLTKDAWCSFVERSNESHGFLRVCIRHLKDHESEKTKLNLGSLSIETTPRVEFQSINSIEILARYIDGQEVDLGLILVEDNFLGSRNYLMNFLSHQEVKLHVIAEIDHHHSIFSVVPKECKNSNPYAADRIERVFYRNKEDLQQSMRFLNHLEETRARFKSHHLLRYIHVSSTEEAHEAMINSPDSEDAVFLVSKKFIDSEVKELHRFQLNQSHIENDPNSCCRYLVISKKPITGLNLQRKFKTSLIIETDGASDTLVKILFCFSSRDLSIYQWESRPSLRTRTYYSPTSPSWHVSTRIDVEGHFESNPMLQSAIHNLREFASYLNILGSFPIYSNMQELERIESIENFLGGPYGL